MNRNSYGTILAIVALTMFGATNAPAQTGQQHQPGDKKASTQAGKKAIAHTNHDMSEMDKSGMMNEPHHVLAMAYKQTVETFAKALRDQAQGSALSTDFARAAVAEISRSLDSAYEHHQEHVKTMSVEARSNMAALIKEMDLHCSKLKAAVSALEKDVRDYTLDSKQIAADSAEVLKRLDDMSKMHEQE